jgi:hypothetical protein
MRETRSSGSVEGVMGNHDSYSDSIPPGLPDACVRQHRVQRHGHRTEAKPRRARMSNVRAAAPRSADWPELRPERPFRAHKRRTARSDSPSRFAWLRGGDTASLYMRISRHSLGLCRSEAARPSVSVGALGPEEARGRRSGEAVTAHDGTLLAHSGPKITKWGRWHLTSCREYDSFTAWIIWCRAGSRPAFVRHSRRRPS